MTAFSIAHTFWEFGWLPLELMFSTVRCHGVHWLRVRWHLRAHCPTERRCESPQQVLPQAVKVKEKAIDLTFVSIPQVHEVHRFEDVLQAEIQERVREKSQHVPFLNQLGHFLQGR